MLPRTPKKIYLQEICSSQARSLLYEMVLFLHRRPSQCPTNTRSGAYSCTGFRSTHPQ
jgi:hypothetical protein